VAADAHQDNNETLRNIELEADVPLGSIEEIEYYDQTMSQQDFLSENIDAELAFDRSFGRSVVRSFGRSVVRSFGRSVVRSFGRSVVRSFGRLVVRSFGRLVVRSVGRSVGKSVCR
jgi:hypothetical protein